ncbi:zinc ribbon domain-containing protein [Candidatus Saccharibacteria bacterium]|nr:zinc ribbon domain-containing protein [Candidatus Saccharibacteria bacterium]
MAKSQTYKAFTARPTHILNLDGEVLDSAPIMSQLASEVCGISAYATYVVRNDTVLGEQLAKAGAVQPTTAGRRVGVTMPDFLVTGKSGRSRKEALIQHRVVTEYRSWQERAKAVNGESSKYVSQGWKRTANAAPPSYGEGDFINLGAVNKQYAAIENNPFADGEINLKLVIQGKWYRLIFTFDNKRFTEGKVTLPLIKIEDSRPVFIFSVATDNPVIQFSSEYTIGVDVGINNYATVAVRNTATGKVTHRTTLSQRVHSLWNSVRASERQVKKLREKAVSLSLYDRQAIMAALDEADLHRKAASRKKRELAILAAQEIAYLSHFFDNAVVAVEDLSWISNTMQNGRWNRGAFVQWLTHYVSQNGGWVVSVSAANTSQVCHVCGEEVTHPKHKVSQCAQCGVFDRDVNAAANIAARAVPKVEKARKKRSKNSKLQPQAPLNTPVARCSLKYPGRDRTKNAPTPKRKKKGVNTLSSPARAQAKCLEATVLADCNTCSINVTGTSQAAIKQGNKTYTCRLCNLN